MAGNIVILKNEYLTVNIDSYGAEIKSIISENGDERIHQSDMFRKRSAPVLFPICGSLYDGKLRIDKEKYPMNADGFSMVSDFDIMEFTDDLAVFSLVSNDETRKIYPYDFELIVTYKLLGRSIDVSYEIINDGKEKMYFSIGSSEAYNCMSGLNNYEIEFETEEIAVPYSDIEGDLGFTGGAIRSFSLSDGLFKDSRSVIFKNPASNALILKNKDNSERIRVEYEGFSHLLISSKPNTQFVCIKPWCGIGELNSSPDDISDKEGIIELMSKEQFEIHHIITLY